MNTRSSLYISIRYKKQHEHDTQSNQIHSYISSPPTTIRVSQTAQHLINHLPTFQNPVLETRHNIQQIKLLNNYYLIKYPSKLYSKQPLHLPRKKKKAEKRIEIDFRQPTIHEVHTQHTLSPPNCLLPFFPPS
jgi:hypothetical protein